jgi:L-glutamine-phosphate cytidylyltransferase
VPFVDLPDAARQRSDFNVQQVRPNPVRVIILAAGQGKRLLPLTSDIPKALLDIGGKPLIQRQIEAFAICGITDFAVVTGYGADRIEAFLGDLARELDVKIECCFNPFYAVADNLASCWIARHLMTGDFVQVNGDNVFQSDLVRRLIDSVSATVAVAVNYKPAYDADDMKVMMDHGRLTEVGKMLPLDTVNAEAIGFYVFRDSGVRAYVNELELAMREPSGIKRWFPSAVGSLAKKVHVSTIEMTGLAWCEVDFPVDLQGARQLVSGWKDA